MRSFHYIKKIKNLLVTEWHCSFIGIIYLIEDPKKFTTTNNLLKTVVALPI